MPRARRVHQPLWTTPPSVLVSLIACVRHTIRAALYPESAWDVLILNGPGTCFSICTAVYFNRVSLLLSHRYILGSGVGTDIRTFLVSEFTFSKGGIRRIFRPGPIPLSFWKASPTICRQVSWFSPVSSSPNHQSPNRFIVQWPGIQQDGRNQHFGCLV